MKGARDIELRIPEEDIRYHTVLKEHSKVSHVDASHNKQVPPRDPQHIIPTHKRYAKVTFGTVTAIMRPSRTSMVWFTDS